MSRYYVRFRNLPIKFQTLAGKDVGSQVAVNMASLFDTREDAYTRALFQWGDVGMEHIEICTFGAPEKPARQRTAPPAPPSREADLFNQPKP